MKPTLQGLSKRTLLVILDGFGIGPDQNKNAIIAAKKPNIDLLFAHYPYTTIEAGGEEVGLPKGVPGNSEVGHMNLGAGKAIRQDLVIINESIHNQLIESRPEFGKMVQFAKSHTKRIHVLGLLSDGGVHSHIEHFKAIIPLLTKHQDLQVFFHAFMDGRDTSKTNGVSYVEEFQKIPGVTLASMQGRSIGMDRDRRWEKIGHCYKTWIGEDRIDQVEPMGFLKSQYDDKIFDEFITPTLFHKDYAIREGDTVFFLNFRPDRARQITLALNDPSFKEFPVPVKPGYFLCMTPYVNEELPNLPILFDKEKIPGTLSEHLSNLGLKQLKMAETEKYAHVTYFFNGGEHTAFPGETHVLIPSPREVATYDLKPEMSALLVKDRLKEFLQDTSYSFYTVNFANSDMVGHTGNYKAAIKAIETLDQVVGELMKVCEEQDITMLLTADHGNSDQMVYEDGSPHTAHTGAPVPFVAFSKKLKNQKLESAQKKFSLKDVAPTVLYSLGIEKPAQMSGQTIFL